MRLCLLFLFAILSHVTCLAQEDLAWESGPPFRHHWQHSYNRLIEGGDGHFYLFQNREGSFWNFGQGGVGRGKVLVFDSTLICLGRFPATVGGERIRMLEAFPSQDGVSVVCLLNEQDRRGSKLGVAHFHPGKGFESGSLDTLLTLPRYSSTWQLPRLRVLMNDSLTRKAITWRKGTDPLGVDNNLGILVLDAADRPVGQPFYPLARAQSEVELLKLAWAGAGEWLFHVRAFARGGKPIAGQVQGQVLVHFDETTQTLESVSLKEGWVVLDLQWSRRASGVWDLTGVYADPRLEPVEAGIFWGQWGGGDSLQTLAHQPFPDSIRQEFVLGRSMGKDPVARSLFYNRLLRSGDTLSYVVNLRGGAVALNPELTGSDYHAMLMSWRIVPGEEPLLVHRWGLFHDGRTDYQETFSWAPVLYQGHWHALTNDFSNVRRISLPKDAKANLLPLDPHDSQLIAYSPADYEPFTVLAPRSIFQTRSGDWVAYARSDKHVRLVRLTGDSMIVAGNRLETGE